MLFTLSGDAVIGGENIREKTAVRLTDGDSVTIKSTDKSAQVLFISSTALNEPVAWSGPIVMNTQSELRQAFDDLNRGTFLQKEMTYNK